MSLLFDYAQQIENYPAIVAFHESLYLFPLVEGTHLLGLAFSVGILAVIDLRLLGVAFRGVPKGLLLKQLRPWLLWGFSITFVTGLILLASEASTAISNPAFLYKLAFIALAGVNAVVFEWRTRQEDLAHVKAHQIAALPEASTHQVARHATLPARSARYDQISGGVSLLLWVLVIVSGRLIPYLASHA